MKIDLKDAAYWAADPVKAQAIKESITKSHADHLELGLPTPWCLKCGYEVEPLWIGGEV